MGRRAFLLAASCWAAVGLSSAWAQPLSVPPGRWWQRPRVAGMLGLSPEQKQKLETTTIEHARAMVDLKAAVEKAELELRVAAEAEPFDANRVKGAFASLQQARMRLESERFDLLVAQRQLLSPEQWRQLRDLARQFMERRRDERGRPGEEPEGERRPLRPH